MRGSLLVSLGVAIVALSLLSAGPTAAQPYPGGILASDFNPRYGGGIYRIDSTGGIATLARAFVGGEKVAAMHGDNRRLVVMTYESFRGNGPHLHLVDPATGNIVNTIFRGTRSYVFFRSFTAIHTGDVVVTGHDGVSPVTGVLFKWDIANRSMSTLIAGAPLARPEMVQQDLVTGDLVVCDPSVGALFRISPDGKVLVTIALHPKFAASRDMDQNHRDGSFLIAGGPVLRVDRLGGVSTFLGASPYHGLLAFDREAGAGQVVTGDYTRVARFDLTGKLTTLHVFNPSYHAWGRQIRFYRERNVVSFRVSPGNVWQFLLSFPGESSRSYALGLSVSGFSPGISVGGRAIPLELDPVLVASISGGMAAVLTNNVGFLDASGAAAAQLDLRALGSLVSGLRVWAAAVTLDPQSPTGLATITKPIVVILD